MQTSNRLFDDFAKVAAGAFTTLSGLREEIESRVRERVERMAADLDLVNREELDAVKAMAAKARSEQEKLATKVAELERRLGELDVETPEVKTPQGRRKAAKDDTTTA